LYSTTASHTDGVLHQLFCSTKHNSTFDQYMYIIHLGLLLFFSSESGAPISLCDFPNFDERQKPTAAASAKKKEGKRITREKYHPL
jgi:hypothetical protein